MQLQPPASNDQLSNGGTVIRHPILADAAAIHRLVEDSEILDMNSRYLYLLLCRDFSRTCRVAQKDNKIIGFVTAYIPPNQPQVLFIWQISVASDHRGHGIAMRMLVDLLAGLPESRAFTIEATIAPSNLASENLFKSLARRLKCDLRIDDGFQSDLFLPAPHEAERMFYIGPIVSGPGMADAHTAQKEVKP